MKTTLINFITKLKNASIARKGAIEIEYTNSVYCYLPILYKEGYIQSYCVKTELISKKTIKIYLRHYQNRVLTENIKLLSIPSRTKILSYNNLSQISLKNRLMILSTSRGIVGHKECLKYKIGGIAMFIC